MSFNFFLSKTFTNLVKQIKELLGFENDFRLSCDSVSCHKIQIYHTQQKYNVPLLAILLFKKPLKLKVSFIRNFQIVFTIQSGYSINEMNVLAL